MYISYVTYKETVWGNSLNSRLSGVSITGHKEWTVFTVGLHTLHAFNSSMCDWLLPSALKIPEEQSNMKERKKNLSDTTNLKGLC